MDAIKINQNMAASLFFHRAIIVLYSFDLCSSYFFMSAKWRSGDVSIEREAAPSTVCPSSPGVIGRFSGGNHCGGLK
jgi:hypothetical protein